MECIGTFIAVLIVIVLWNVVYWSIKRVGSTALGTLNPLPRKDDGTDDPSRGVQSSSCSNDGATLFVDKKNARCPVHQEAYTGYTVLELVLPPQPGMFVGTGEQERVLGYLNVIGCNQCAREACKHWDFVWKRDNHELHPTWAGAQIYPHLLQDKFLRVKTPFFLFPGEQSAALAYEWIQSDNPQTRSSGVFAIANPQFKTEENVRLLESLLADDGVGIVQVDGIRFPRFVVRRAAFAVLHHSWDVRVKEPEDIPPPEIRKRYAP